MRVGVKPMNNDVIKKAQALCVRGEAASLRRMLARNAELAAIPGLINAAALHGHSATVEVLLEAGADPDAQVVSHEYYRPLHRAIEHRGVPRNDGHLRVAEMLLDAGASLEKRSTWMQLTPLAVAGMAGDPEMIALLVGRGAPVTIFEAAVTVNVAKLRSFLRKPQSALAKDANNMTVLHYAALSGLGEQEYGAGQREIAQRLLDAGADGDSREPIGPYPPTPVLHFAAWKNYPLAEVLLRHGCDPNHGFGNCLWREPGRMAELFFSHGADVNAREASGQPLLNSRIHWNLASVVLWLLKKGADPKLADPAGNTALHEAAGRGVHVRVVQALLEAGAEKSARNQAGLTAFDIAIQKKREKLAGVLA
jgi:ankyrin repeat protein